MPTKYLPYNMLRTVGLLHWYGTIIDFGQWGHVLPINPFMRGSRKFRLRADDGPILNAGLVALWFFRGSGPVLLRSPIFLWFFFLGGGGGRTPSPPPLDPPILQMIFKNSKWVWSGNTTITNRRQTRGTAGKSRSTIARHQEDKLSKATSSLFPIKMIAILEWT